jgi:hypothetical protein
MGTALWQNPGQTLQASVLVHQTYLRLVDVEKTRPSRSVRSAHALSQFPHLAAIREERSLPQFWLDRQPWNLSRLP